MDGLDICRKLSEREVSNGYFYKILLTGRSDQKAVAQGLDAGADDYIPKPFNTNELSARLNVGKRIIDMQNKTREQKLLERKMNIKAVLFFATYLTFVIFINYKYSEYTFYTIFKLFFIP